LPDRLKSAYPGQILDADAHAVGEALQAGMVGYAISRADLVIVLRLRNSSRSARPPGSPA